MRIRGRFVQRLGRVETRRIEREEMQKVIRRSIPFGEWLHSEEPLHGCEHRRVVVGRVIDDATGNERRDHQCGDAYAEHLLQRAPIVPEVIRP